MRRIHIVASIVFIVLLVLGIWMRPSEPLPDPYAKPIPPADVIIVIPSARVGSQPEAVTVPPTAVAPRSKIDFKGQLIGERTLSGILGGRLWSPTRRGGKQILDNENKEVSSTGAGFNADFVLRLQAPENPGKYQVTLYFGKHTFAEGVLEVK